MIIYTDHKPLTSSITNAHSTFTWSLRAERHLLFISQFTSDIRHVAGESNKVPDALSRPPDPPTILPDDDFTNDIVVQEPFQADPVHRSNPDSYSNSNSYSNSYSITFFNITYNTTR